MTKVTQVTAILLMLCGVHNGLCLAANPAVGEEGWKVELNPYDCKALKGGGPVTFTATATCYGTEESTFLTISWAGAGQAGGPATATSTYITITIPANTPGLYTVTAIGECKKADGTVQNLTATATLEVAEYKVAVSPGTVLSYDTTDISSTKSISWQVTEMTINGVVVDTGASAHFDFDTGQEDVYSGYPYYVQWKIDDDPWVVREKVWPCDLWLEAIFPHEGTNGGVVTEPQRYGEEAIVYPRGFDFPKTIEVRAWIDASDVDEGDRPGCASELTEDFDPEFVDVQGPTTGGFFLRNDPQSEAYEQDWDVDGDAYMWLDGHLRTATALPSGEYGFAFIMSSIDVEISNIIVVELSLTTYPDFLFCSTGVLGAYAVTVTFEGVHSEYRVKLFRDGAQFDWSVEFGRGGTSLFKEYSDDIQIAPEDDIDATDSDDGKHSRYTFFLRRDDVAGWDISDNDWSYCLLTLTISEFSLSDSSGVAKTKHNDRDGIRPNAFDVRLADKDVTAWTLGASPFTYTLQCRPDPTRFFRHHTEEPHDHQIGDPLPGFDQTGDVHDIYFYYDEGNPYGNGIACKLQLKDDTDIPGEYGGYKYTAVMAQADRAMYCCYSYGVTYSPLLEADVMDVQKDQLSVTADIGHAQFGGSVVASAPSSTAETVSIALATATFIASTVAVFYHPAGAPLGLVLFIAGGTAFLDGASLAAAIAAKYDEDARTYDYGVRVRLTRVRGDDGTVASEWPYNMRLIGNENGLIAGDVGMDNNGLAHAGDTEKASVSLSAMVTNLSLQMSETDISLVFWMRQLAGGDGSFPNMNIAEAE